MMASSRETKIVLAAGGTGGHMFPAYAVAQALRQRGYTPVLITDERGARYAAPFAGTEQHELPAANVSKGRISGAINLVRATLAARRLYKTIRPALVMGFGGYATLPALVAARMRGIPRCIHEQNAVLGRVNRALAKSVQKIALSFEDTKRLDPKWRDRVVVTGNPVREEVTALRDTDYAPIKPEGIVRLLVLGGSQGAKILSDVIPGALTMLPDALRHRLQVTQQCRPETIEEARRVYGEAEIANELAPFFNDIATQLTFCHLVIARAGASTISELEVAGRPSVLVPLKIATDDHQTVNATQLAEAGGAWVIREQDFTSEALAELIEPLLAAPEKLAEAAAAARSLALPDAAERLADMVDGLVGGKTAEGPSAAADKPADIPGMSPRMMTEAA